MWIVLLAGAVALAQVADPAYAPLSRAYEAVRIQDYDIAIPLFLQAIELAPNRASIRKDLAYTWLKVGETEEARDQFREASRLDPADEHVALEYAFLCYETKEQAQARRLFDRLRHSGNPATRATAEQAFRNIDEPLQAGIERWTRALDLAGDYFTSHYELATLAEQRDQLALAAEHYEKAWRLRPAQKNVLIDLGRVWLALGRAEEANAALLAASRGGEPRAAEKARELLPSRYPWISEFRRALQLDPNNVELRRELAYLLLRMERASEAEQEFAGITSSAPGDLLSAAQLGFLYLARNNPAAAMPLLRRVLDGDDEELAQRVRAVLRLPQSSADAKLMAERSIKAGYLQDALRYLNLAHDLDPVDFSVMLKLGWTYNVLHDDGRAIRWFDLARKSTDPAISSEAGRAYANLRPALSHVRFTAWAYPMYSSRWRDLFSYGQVKVEWKLNAPFRPYVSLRFIGDTRGTLDRFRPEYLSESAVIVGAGAASRTWKGATLWGEAGEQVSYLRRSAKPDYRGGLAFLRGAGHHSLSSDSPGWFAETAADAVFVSRFGNDFLLYSQNRLGFTRRAGSLRSQIYWNANLVADVRREYWANFAETGPGLRFGLAHVPGFPLVSLNILRGAYTVNRANPRRPSFYDLRVGFWYAFTR